MKRIIVDLFLFILMLLEFSRMYMNPIIHEIFGIILIILFVIHLVFNRGYINNILKLW